MVYLGTLYLFVALVCHFSVHASILECENESLKKTATASVSGIAQTSFCVETVLVPSHYAKVNNGEDICLAHQLCAERFFWWWDLVDPVLGYYTINVQIRDVLTKGGGDFSITIYSNKFKESVTFTVKVPNESDGHADIDKKYKNPKACIEKDLKYFLTCPEGWLPVGGGYCVMGDVGYPVDAYVAEEICEQFGATLIPTESLDDDDDDDDEDGDYEDEEFEDGGYYEDDFEGGDLDTDYSDDDNDNDEDVDVSMKRIKRNVITDWFDGGEKTDDGKEKKRRKEKKDEKSTPAAGEEEDNDDKEFLEREDAYDDNNDDDLDYDYDDDEEKNVVEGYDDEDSDYDYGGDEEDGSDEDYGTNEDDKINIYKKRRRNDNDDDEEDFEEDEEGDEEGDSNVDIFNAVEERRLEEMRNKNDDNEDEDSNEEDEDSNEEDEDSNDEDEDEYEGDSNADIYNAVEEEKKRLEELQKQGDDNKNDDKEGDAFDEDGDFWGDDEEDDDIFGDDEDDEEFDEDDEEFDEKEDGNTEDDNAKVYNAKMEQYEKEEHKKIAAYGRQSGKEDEEGSDDDDDEQDEEGFSIDRCLNARMLTMAGTAPLWIDNDEQFEDDPGCYVYNYSNDTLTNTDSCQFVYNNFGCLFDVRDYVKPKITDFKIELHPKEGDHNDVSFSVTKKDTTYHEVKDDVQKVVIHCEAEGFPVPETVIIELGVTKQGAAKVYDSPHSKDINEIDSDFLGRFSCVAGNVFGDQDTINDLLLLRYREPTYQRYIYPVIFMVVLLCIIMVGTLLIFRLYSKFVTPSGQRRKSSTNNCRRSGRKGWCSSCVCVCFSRRRPSGATQVPSEMFPPNLDYVYGDEEWNNDDIPLYVRRQRRDPNSDSDVVYKELTEPVDHA